MKDHCRPTAWGGKKTSGNKPQINNSDFKILNKHPKPDNEVSAATRPLNNNRYKHSFANTLTLRVYLNV